GGTWSPQTSGTADSISSVKFIDALNGWAGGNAGIFHTSDGGNNWSLQSASAKGSIDFSNLLNGWSGATAAGIFHTTNGGGTWTSQSSTIIPRDFDFLDSLNGWVVDQINGDIRHTTNGGSTWTLQKHSTAEYNGVSFPDSLHGWVSAGATMLKTSDGGTTWTSPAIVGSFFNASPAAVEFLDDSNGWVAGFNNIGSGNTPGAIYHTINGGGTWTGQTLPTTAFINGIQFVVPEPAGASLIFVAIGGFTLARRRTYRDRK